MTIYDKYSALQDFRRARQRADMERIIANIRGKSADLLPFDEVRMSLNIQINGPEKLKEIPVKAIVGSVGRYSDFTRGFLPKTDSDQNRWVGVLQATQDITGVPPIDVYQIGDVYFVKDGNHRVSVARELKIEYIQAYVTELESNISLSPDIQPDDLILKAEYNEFLEHTHLKSLRPEADLTITVPGQYPILDEHIAVHCYYMGIEQKRDIPYEEAVTHWYDNHYLPMIFVIRERGVLRDFPNRTETDMYLWVSEHQAELEEALGMSIRPTTAVIDLVEQYKPSATQSLLRWGSRLLSVFTPDELEGGPATGEWRKQYVEGRQQEYLFEDILVPVSGKTGGWLALEQAIELASHEKACVHGLHVAPSEELRNSEAAKAVQERFETRLGEMSIRGELTRTSGEVANQICNRARYTDLIVVNVMYPPSPDPLARLSSGFSTIIRRCSRPILAVPYLENEYNKPLSKMTSALLAYGGSPKSEEALFVAAYLSSRWGIKLEVLTILKRSSEVQPQEEAALESEQNTALLPTQERARHYLEGQNVQAQYTSLTVGGAENIVNQVQQNKHDLIIMGGYEAAPVFEVMIGSFVDGVLRLTQVPVLICR